MDFEPLRHTRLVTDQPLDVGAKRMRERLRERRQKDAAVRIRPRQMDGAVQRDDGLPRAGGTGHASRPGVVVGDELTLLGVQEDRPLVPRRIQSAFEFLDARHDAETPLGIGMRERIRPPAPPASSDRGVPPVASSRMASAASAGRCWARASRPSSSACRTSLSHSEGTPYPRS